MFAFLVSEKTWVSDLCLPLCGTAHLMTPGLPSPPAGGHLAGCPRGRPWTSGAGLLLGGVFDSLADRVAGGRPSVAESPWDPETLGCLWGGWPSGLVGCGKGRARQQEAPFGGPGSECLTAAASRRFGRVRGREGRWPRRSVLNSQVIASGILTSVCRSGGRCCQRGGAVLIGPAGEDSRSRVSVIRSCEGQFSSRLHPGCE